MKRQIVYLKEVNSYDDILKKERKKVPLILKKVIFLFKNMFNLITKKKIDETNIWILPVKEKYCENKINSIMRKNLVNTENIYVLSNELMKNQIYKILDYMQIKYITEEKIKKILLIKTLNYIAKLQKKEINNFELSVLVNEATPLNMFLIEEFAKLVRNLKIISLSIYKFKKIEEKLYNDYGIAVQFSNSYKKSLEKSKIIINLDFNEIEINEYKIFDNAIIINSTKDNIKIKSKLFNGLIINSCEIDFKQEIIKKFKQIHIFEKYKKIIIYASLIENENNISKIYEMLEKDKVKITNLIGNNGIINKKEFKNIKKTLDKNIKKE